MSYEKDFLVSKYEWPYPIRYDKENEVSADVLILGGGIAGCWAAISAAKRGAKVVMVEKSSTIKSGAGNGCDHWHSTCGHPACKVTAEELAQAIVDCHKGWDCGIHRYIECRDSYDTLLEMEKMGAKVRDSEDEFKGAEFRDENTKFLFAYDYENKYSIRVWGTTFKPALFSECKKLRVNILDRIMVTSLLTEGGKQGARVVGATGVNVRTGEFYTFKGKATILCMSRPVRTWVFTTEYTGLHSHEPNLCAGDGHAMAWNVGAEFTMMEKSRSERARSFGYPAYGTGNSGNTWHACTMIDAKGKEIPWVDRDGNVLTTVSQRYRPAPGQKFTVQGGGLSGDNPYKFKSPKPIYSRDVFSGRESGMRFDDLIEKGDITLPLYADLPSMSEHERRAIFGLMVGQEGKTWILYRNLTQAGFDPEKDMLQGYQGMLSRVTGWRTAGFNSGGLVVDWDLKTNLPGLYAAGQQIYGSENHGNAAMTGRWAGAKAADYALKAGESMIDRGQVEKEKMRVYAPIKRKEGMEWKELNAGICRVMQEWCGEKKSEELLKTGLTWLKEIREGEATTVYARNPHELMRVLECFSILTVGEMIMHASLARKASSKWLNLYRTDYPEVDPPDWNKLIATRLENGEIKFHELTRNYYLQSPNASTLKENYELHKPR